MAEAIGIDIGGTHIRAGRIGPAGELLAQAERPSERDARAVLMTCLNLVAEFRTPDVAAVGVGIPGRVVSAGRRVLSGGYVDLSPFDFAGEIEAAAGLPVALENDAAMALVAEAARGAARGCRNSVMLTIGTGIGGAVLDGGTLLRGGGTAGQLGHLVVQRPGRPCLCGRSGCLETVSSGTAFARHLAEAGLPAETRAEALVEREDAAARQVIENWAGPLRQAIDSLVAALAPEVVVLGGGVGGAAAAAVNRLLQPSPWYQAPIMAAELGDTAGMIGAGLAALRARPGAGSKRVILVNGVPASGKSTVSAALSAATGWPRLALDTIKNPFLAELPPGDRLFNRSLGRASYAAIFGLLEEAPQGHVAIVDAWFGFQPVEVLKAGLARAGVTEVLELWCEASAEEIGARYAARVGKRPPGHPGSEYVPELIELARRAAPVGLWPVMRVETATRPDTRALLEWIRGRWPEVAPQSHTRG